MMPPLCTRKLATARGPLGDGTCGYAQESIIHTRYLAMNDPNDDAHPFEAPEQLPPALPAHYNQGATTHGHDAWTCRCGWWGSHSWMGYASHLEAVLAGRQG